MFFQTNSNNTESFQANLKLQIYGVSIVFLMLYSMFFYYTWNWDYRFVEIAYILICSVYLGKRLSLLSKWISVILFLCFSIIWNSGLNSIGILLSLHIPFILSLTLDDHEKEYILRLWTVVFSIIISVSLICWICAPFDFIPIEGIVDYGDNNSYSYISYYLCLQSISSWQDFTRFTSLFLEPGHVGMIAAFTVFANGFNFKNKYNVVIFIGALSTLSLAAYLLLIIGYILTVMKEFSVRNIILVIISLILIVFTINYVGTNYRNGQNFINEYIIERLTLDEEKGLAGNNRFHGNTDALFENSIENGQIITGMPIEQFKKNQEVQEISGAGFKIFMLEKGIIGTFSIFMAYFLLYKQSNNKRLTMGMLILYFFAFLQRSYPFWYVWLILYLFTTVDPEIKENNTKLPDSNDM